ncbi:uncharacterized protein LOC105441007 [Strongylocentrotus purpuratus]|uniref:Death domain-containing protein n=1 Tax=Strongylocentrotus purpuratus TaxID=7668 RepID=A0A7M7PAE8_STRPU|nr:uncharacterized protein LOC105441007 [Strongylocentrotus purpuratus]
MAPTRKNLFVLWKTGELKIRWEVDSGHGTENEKTVSLDDIYRLDRNNVNFLVKGTSDANVPFKINMHLHCNEEHAFGVKYSGITETSQGITNSTSPRPSASTPVDISPQGASACTSNARKVSDEMLNSLAQHVPTYAYNKFSGKLGIEHNQAGNILDKYKSDYEKATRECLAKWMDRSNRDVADLHEVLRAVDLGGLIIYCN